MTAGVEPAVHEGGCLCGAVRYRIGGAPHHVGHCHCSMCRRGTGAVAVTWLYAPVRQFVLVRGAPRVYRSSAEAERHFCGACGSSLFFRSEAEPEMIDIAVATLDDPEAWPANHHNYAADRLGWLTLDPELPAYEGDTPLTE